MYQLFRFCGHNWLRSVFGRLYNIRDGTLRFLSTAPLSAFWFTGSLDCLCLGCPDPLPSRLSRSGTSAKRFTVMLFMFIFHVVFRVQALPSLSVMFLFERKKVSKTVVSFFFFFWSFGGVPEEKKGRRKINLVYCDSPWMNRMDAVTG